VLIGAVGDNTGVSAAGAAYLFSTNGALQVTFTNPTPAVHDEFGWCVVAVGTDRVLIAAPGDDTGATDVGAAYLFRANGTLLTIFTNPAPNSTPTPLVSFGSSVAVVGTDQVLIGSPWNNTGANHTGAAYLFSTNGTLLTTFTNPAPAAYDNFGRSVAALGSDQVLIAASFDDIGAKDAGAAYLFSTNGTLLKTFSKPTPAASDGFGSAVAALGTNCVLIAALGDDTGATNSGAVYLFSVAVQTAGAPVLTICLTTTNTVAVSWPSPSTDWTLQENTNGVVSVNWSNRTSSILDDGTNKVLIIGPPTGDRFYRLFKP
jgi:hypothetical protein